MADIEHGSACNDGIQVGDGPVYECHGECVPAPGTETRAACAAVYAETVTRLAAPGTETREGTWQGATPTRTSGAADPERLSTHTNAAPGEPGEGQWCHDCPDHEACATGWRCDDVKSADLVAARAEAAGLQAEVERLRTRIHEAVDECQRRYAPTVKALARLMSARNQANRWFEEVKAEGDEWSRWQLMSEVERTFIADLIDARDAATAEAAGLRERLAAVEALCDRADANPFGQRLVAVSDVRAAASPEVAPAPTTEGS